jgi:hypothetical protein
VISGNERQTGDMKRIGERVEAHNSPAARPALWGVIWPFLAHALLNGNRRRQQLPGFRHNVAALPQLSFSLSSLGSFLGANPCPSIQGNPRSRSRISSRSSKAS